MAFAQERDEKYFAADPEPWQKAEKGSIFKPERPQRTSATLRTILGVFHFVSWQVIP